MQDFQALFNHLVDTRYIGLTNINYLSLALRNGHTSNYHQIWLSEEQQEYRHFDNHIN